MHFLDTLGLENLAEPEDNLMVVVRHVFEEGKVFNGYRGLYAYINRGYAELLDHVAPNDDNNANELVGFSSHCMGNNNWRLEIADKGVMEEDTDVMSKCVYFCDPNVGEQSFPVRLVMSDVLPCYLPGEKVTMQVQAFPSKIEYFRSEEDFLEARSTKFMGNYLQFCDGHIMTFGIDDSCFMKATVKNVRKIFGFDIDGLKKNFMYVTVGTEYGDIAFCHSIDMVDENQREFIKEGATVFSTFVISGDVAIGEYQEGAVYDEEHDLKLLRDALANNTFARCHKAFAEDAKFVSVDGEIKCDNKKDCLDRLERQAAGMAENGRTIYAYPATIVGYHDEMINNPCAVGKRVLLLSYDTPAYFIQLITIETNDEGKIAKFILQNCASYKIHIDMKEEWQRNELTALNVVKESLDSADVSKLINLIDDNAWFIMKKTIKARTSYEVLYYLQEVIRVFKNAGAEVNNYLVTIRDYKDKLAIPKYMPGKLALVMSLKDVESYETILLIQLGDNGEITAVELLDDSDYIVEEVSPNTEICQTYAEEHRFTPVNINRSAAEWLDVLTGWFNKSDEENYEFLFYNGMSPDVVCIVNEDGIETEYNGKEPVYGNVQVFANLDFNKAYVENDEMVCDGLHIKLETNDEGRINRICMRLEKC